MLLCLNFYPNHFPNGTECKSIVLSEIKSGWQKWIFHRTFISEFKMICPRAHVCLYIRRIVWETEKGKAKQPPTAISKNKQSTNALGIGLFDASTVNTLSINYNDWADLGHSMHESICNQIKHPYTNANGRTERWTFASSSEQKKSAQPNQLCSKVDRVCIQIA